jgi:hypothetical protein
MTTLKALSVATLVALHNSAVVDYAPEGFTEVEGFKNKKTALKAVEAVLTAGNLAVTFDGDNAVIVDAMQGGEGDEAEGEGEGDDNATDDAVKALGDGKGALRAWGVKLAGDDWLKANARGTVDREAYRKERRKAARTARKQRIAQKQEAIS